jgi:predicted acyltransferase
MDPASALPKHRLTSLDQFRGYTVAGMFLVNFLGAFAVTPAVVKHHNCYCSYADTIMPQFLFAVGFAFRLTFGRRAQTEGLPAAYRRVARRLGGLVLVALVLYSLEGGKETWNHRAELGIGGTLAELFKRHWFQTLMHIAVTSLWILPVIRAGAGVRLMYLVFSATLHVGLSAWFNFVWVNTPPVAIDGGPLGFLTWSIPVLVGTLACDAVTRPGFQPSKLLAWSCVLMLLGYGLSCGTRLYDRATGDPAQDGGQLAASPVLLPVQALGGREPVTLLAEPPFVCPPEPAERGWNYWMMSQRSGTISYLTFAAGFSLAVYVLFYLACDRLGWGLGVFRTLGTNALAAYILGGLLEQTVQERIPKDAPSWHVALGFVVFFGMTYLLIWLLERAGVRLRL